MQHLVQRQVVRGSINVWSNETRRTWKTHAGISEQWDHLRSSPHHKQGGLIGKKKILSRHLVANSESNQNLGAIQSSVVLQSLSVWISQHVSMTSLRLQTILIQKLCHHDSHWRTVCRVTPCVRPNRQISATTYCQLLIIIHSNRDILPSSIPALLS